VEIKYSSEALEDLAYWKKLGIKAILNRISLLITSIENTPFEGIGKPEPLKHDLAGQWSRRINRKDRIIYEVNDYIEILSLRGHYDK
jgi:toxin YoeB